MRKVGKLAAELLDLFVDEVKPGVTTESLDCFAYEFIKDNGAIPAPLNYRGFKKSICTSINHVICHGIPSDRVLDEGDIVNIDVTLILDGWHGDTSRMYSAGNPSVKARNLINNTYEAMMKGINLIKPGVKLGDLGFVIQNHAETNNYSVVREFCGHGLGEVFHDEPNILHYGVEDTGLSLQEGMFFTVEPMVNIGKPESKILSDGWTAVTRDRSLSAQFEHSVGVTSDGVEIFTRSLNKRANPIEN
jgi:methionyl aminopeptidase|tara:strand:+ start:2853 stop:3593 length:741 start_codon:yes stop_codon:yes gene_type:complete